VKTCSEITGAPACIEAPRTVFEARAAGFPTHRMREGALGHCKWSEVSRNIEWLNAELRIIFARGVAPPAEFDVHFAVMLIAAPVIKGIHAQDCGRLQVSGVTNHNDVGFRNRDCDSTPPLAHDHLSPFFVMRRCSAPLESVQAFSAPYKLFIPPRSPAIVRTSQS